MKKKHPGITYFKYSNSDDVPFSCIDLNKKKRGRRTMSNNITLSLLYPDGRAVAKPKLLDLKTLLQFIPPVNHSFYRKLQCSDEDSGDDIWTDTDNDLSDIE